MNRTTKTFALAILASALGAGSARADTAPFVFDRAIYGDEKEVALKSPDGVACTDAGDIAIADTGNGRIVLFRYQGGSLSAGKPLKPAGLSYPVRVQYDSKGNLLVLDLKSRKILRLDPAGKVLGILEPKGGSALTMLPVSFKLDASDHVFVLDAVGRRVMEFDPAGAVVRQVDLPKAGIFGDIHVDGTGTIYALDSVNASIWTLEKGGTVFKALTQSMKDKMNFPVYITGSKGKLYLVDQNGNGVVVLGIDGAYQGRQLAIGWGQGLVYYPAQLCINGSGEAFIADRSNNRVQIFNIGK